MQKKLNLGSVAFLFGILLVVVTLICLVGAGIHGEMTLVQDGMYAHIVLEIPTSDFLFGGLTLKATSNGIGVNMKYDGGMSIFALISFIFTIIGLVSILGSAFLKKRNLIYLGSGLIFVGGICMFMLKVAGTDVSMSLNGQVQTITFDDFLKSSPEAPINLGAGAICYGIFAILSSLVLAATPKLHDKYTPKIGLEEAQSVEEPTTKVDLKK